MFLKTISAILLSILFVNNLHARLGAQESFGHKIFIDQNGQQIILRGMNVSGSVKLKSTGFRPFINSKDASDSLFLLKENLGANIIRLAVAWEGIEPSPGTIDLKYLLDIVSFIKQAAQLKIFVLIDFHQDLFSRHIFKEGQKFKGNGAPEWITQDLNDEGKCGLFCFHWAQNNLTNKAVRKSYRQFFNNEKMEINWNNQEMIFYMQDAYIEMASSFIKMLKQNLSSEVWDYVIGVDPFNEPVDGGLEGLTHKEWDRQKLWPFYLKLEKVLEQKELGELLIFAEPLVFWNSNVGFMAPASGTGYFKGKLSHRFVFNAHFYDARRQGPFVFHRPKVGEYLRNMDAIRAEAKRLKVPAFVSEFGAPIQHSGKKSPGPILKEMYLAFDLSSVKLKKVVRAPFYSQAISYTQWHWDINYNQHQEENEKGERLKYDAWNGENFSVVKNRKGEYNLPTSLVEKIQLNSTAGRVYHLISNLPVPFSSLALYQEGKNNFLLKDRPFFFAAFEGAKKEGVHQFFIPSSFGPFSVLTSLGLTHFQGQKWVNIKASETDDFVLIFKRGDLWQADIFQLQKDLIKQINQKKSPAVIIPD